MHLNAESYAPAMKAQRPCLIRAKIIMALSYATLRGPSVCATLDVCSILFFLYNDIFGIKVASVETSYDVTSSLHYVTLTIRLHFARRLLLCLQSVLHHTWLENSEWCIHPHTMLLNCNTRFTQQTLMQPLYVTLFIMLRCYRDEFQIAGAKNATQQIRNRPGSTYAKSVFISGRGPTTKDKREKCFILHRRSNNNKAQTHLPLKHQNITKTSQNLYQKWYTRHLRYPKMVIIWPKNGQLWVWVTNNGL